MNDRCSYEDQLVPNSVDATGQSYLHCVSDGHSGFYGCLMKCPPDTIFYESLQKCWFMCTRSEAHTDTFCDTQAAHCEQAACTSQPYDVKGQCTQYRYCFRNASMSTLAEWHVCQQSCPAGRIFSHSKRTCTLAGDDDPSDECISCESGSAVHDECEAVRPRPSCPPSLPCQTHSMDHPDPDDCHRFQYCYRDAEQAWLWSRCTQDCGLDHAGARLGFDSGAKKCARPNNEILCTFRETKPVQELIAT
jgi:hypothetical protein